MNQLNPDSTHLSGAKLYLRWLFAGVVAFFALAGGTYVGYSKAFQDGFASQQVAALNRSLLDLGDKFPNYELFRVDSGTETTVSQLLSDGPVLLIFMSRTCPACEMMEAYWAKKVVPNLRTDIQLVCVYGDDEWPGADTLGIGAPFGRALVTTTTWEDQKEADGMTATPTLVALDATGTIRLLATGFSRTVSSDLVNELL